MNPQIPQNLEMMAAQAMKQYKVHVKLEKIDMFTIWAHDPEEAVKMVIKEGLGRPAGSIGPNIIDIRIDEQGGGSTENAAILENAAVEQDPKVKPLIEVVGS